MFNFQKTIHPTGSWHLNKTYKYHHFRKKSTDKKLINEMDAWEAKNEPEIILMISSDQDFNWKLKEKKNNGNTIYVISIDESTAEEMKSIEKKNMNLVMLQMVKTLSQNFDFPYFINLM